MKCNTAIPYQHSNRKLVSIMEECAKAKTIGHRNEHRKICLFKIAKSRVAYVLSASALAGVIN